MIDLLQRLRDWWTPYAPNSLGDKYLKLYRAIQQRRRVSALLGREPIVFCPHVLGFRRAAPYVLGFAISTAHATEARGAAGEGWCWIAVADLHNVRTHTGPWCSGPPPMPPFEGVEIQIKAAA
jgi:hypothetical protein